MTDVVKRIQLKNEYFWASQIQTLVRHGGFFADETTVHYQSLSGQMTTLEVGKAKSLKQGDWLIFHSSAGKPMAIDQTVFDTLFKEQTPPAPPPPPPPTIPGTMDEAAQTPEAFASQILALEQKLRRKTCKQIREILEDDKVCHLVYRTTRQGAWPLYERITKGDLLDDTPVMNVLMLLSVAKTLKEL